MQNNGKHSRPDQAYGQQANRPANMGRQAPARPQQPYGQQAYQRPPYQQPRYAQQPGQQPPQNGYGNPYGRQDFNFQPLPSNHEHDGMIRVKKKRRKKHTKLIVCIVIIACLLVGTCGYGAALALSAKDVKAQAETALSNVNGIQTAIAGQDFATAAKNASNLQSSAQAMNEELSSPVWNVAAMLPVVGSDVKGVQTIASALADASDNAIVPLTTSLSTTPPSACIDADGKLNIAAITTLLGAIQNGAPAMQRCTDELSSLPAFHIEKLQKLVGPAQEKITGINDVFQQANTFAPIIGSMLGANGNRTYLLAAQNTAEIRASGGFPGSMGTVSIDNGAIELGDFTKVYDMMAEETPAQCAITDEENALFYPWYTQYSWDNSFNPDYPRVAGIWAAAYQEKTEQSVDGVISITPTMVQDLLAATGDSFTLSDGTTIDGTNATKVLQHDLYWKYLSSGSNMSEGNDLCDALFAEAAEYAFDSALENMNASSLMKLVSTMMGGLDGFAASMILAGRRHRAGLHRGHGLFGFHDRRIATGAHPWRVRQLLGRQQAWLVVGHGHPGLQPRHGQRRVPHLSRDHHADELHDHAGSEARRRLHRLGQRQEPGRRRPVHLLLRSCRRHDLRRDGIERRHARQGNLSGS